MSGNSEVELKGGMYTFMSLKLHTDDLDTIDKRLGDKVQQAPGFFKDTPVVIDLTVLEEKEDSELDAHRLLELVRSHQLEPIVASICNKSSPLATSIALPLIEGSARRQNNSKKPDRADKGQSEDAAESPQADQKSSTAAAGVASAEARVDLELGRQVEVVVKTPMLVNRPVRSGQQVYARDTDLIVLGQIGPGAEIIADNNIHVYGPLRGRALCGVSGNTDARIFCQSLEAELVSVAGNYRVLEEIPGELRGKPAQIRLDKDRLAIEPL